MAPKVVRWSLRFLYVSLLLIFAAVAGAVLYAVIIKAAGAPALPVADVSPLRGASLYSDVLIYTRFGEHRTGTDADKRTSEWIRRELAALGFRTGFREFPVRQYFFHGGNLRVDGTPVPVFPQWWPPEKGPVHVEGPLSLFRDDGASYGGKIVLVKAPRKLTAAYLAASERDAIHRIAKAGALAAVMVIEHKSGEIFAYNTTADDKPWPVPVVLAGARSLPLLMRAAERKIPAVLTLRGSYREARSGNVVARLRRGSKNLVVVSTPLTGWFTCTAERGPGVALFLGLARWAARNRIDADFLFVATSGHEIGHSGMDLFMERDAPAPERVTLWVHLGASIASYAWKDDGKSLTRSGGPERYRKLFFFSPSRFRLYINRMGGLGFIPVPGLFRLIGEMEDIRSRGYRSYIGFAGSHRFFHTPRDTADNTGPELLEPVAMAVERCVMEAVVGGKR